MSQYIKKALVLGAGGFIGNHMVRRLRSEGYWVRGVDIKYPEYSVTEADEFISGDLTDQIFMEKIVEFRGYGNNYYKFIPFKYIGAVSYTHLPLPTNREV